MSESLLKIVRTTLHRSELLRAVRSVRSDGGHTLALPGGFLRRLTDDEVTHLEKLGNTADSWSRVRVADGFDCRRVRQSHFQGDVTLGHFAGAVRLTEGIDLPSGIVRSTVVNSVIGHDALVQDVRLLGNQIVGEGALLWDCGRVVCSGRTAFGNGQVVPLGVETGERSLSIYAEITVEVARALMGGPLRRQCLEEYERLLAEHVARLTSAHGIVERGASVRHTPCVQDAYLGPYAVIDGATLVQNCTVLSNRDECTHVLSGACVRDTLLQWGSEVSDFAVVTQSVLAEHSHAERHAKVTASLLGPNTGVAEGEVTASVLGPFVGFHHQALVIAVSWPDGKGNISHGACVGCNHTSRAPDQECRLGEGTFVGLGVQLKFPIDLSEAPYCVLASGVTLLPQKLVFPFSLVNAPTNSPPGVPPAFNEIVPAWVLTDNLYLLRRSEAKFRLRNRARRTVIPCEVFRPDTIERIREACRLLEDLGQVKDVYTESDLPGLGKNFLTEANRLRALRGYQSILRWYELRSLCERLRPRRQLHQGLLAHESEAMCELAQLLEQMARGIEQSRTRDDERGRRIIADYGDVHTPAADDPVVRECWAETRRLQQDIKDLIARPVRVPTSAETPGHNQCASFPMGRLETAPLSPGECHETDSLGCPLRSCVPVLSGPCRS